MIIAFSDRSSAMSAWRPLSARSGHVENWTAGALRCSSVSCLGPPRHAPAGNHRLLGAGPVLCVPEPPGPGPAPLHGLVAALMAALMAVLAVFVFRNPIRRDDNRLLTALRCQCALFIVWEPPRLAPRPTPPHPPRPAPAVVAHFAIRLPMLPHPRLAAAD